MKKNLKNLIPLLLLVMLAVTGFTGCDFLGLFGGDESDPVIEILGTWGDSYPLIVDEDSIESSGMWTAEIVDFDNGDWNADETSLAAGDCGYVVIKYLTSEYTPGSIGKYMVLRWQNLGTVSGETNMDYSEGYNGGTYFETAAEAVAGATSDAGFFGWFTAGAVKQ